MKNKYNIKELEEKINRCKNMKLEEAKTVDMNYYIKNSEIPQFMAFLAKE